MNDSRTTTKPVVAAATGIPAVLNAKMLADLLGTKVPTVRKWVREDRLPRPARVGGLRMLWLGSDIEAWLRLLPRR